MTADNSGDNRPQLSPAETGQISESGSSRFAGRDRFVPRVVALVTTVLMLAALSGIPQQALGGIVDLASDSMRRQAQFENNVANMYGGVSRAQGAQAKAERAALGQARLMVDISLPGSPLKITADRYGRVADDMLTDASLGGRKISALGALGEAGFQVEPFRVYARERVDLAPAEGSALTTLPVPSTVAPDLAPQIGGDNAGHPIFTFGEYGVIDPDGTRYTMRLTTPRVVPAGSLADGSAPNLVNGRYLESLFVRGDQTIPCDGQDGRRTVDECKAIPSGRTVGGASMTPVPQPVASK